MAKKNVQWILQDAGVKTDSNKGRVENKSIFL